MPFFSYKARNKKGELQQGVLESKDSGALANLLIAQGMSPLEIKPKASPSSDIKFFEPKVNTLDLMLFSRQMYTLLKAGLPILKSLKGLQTTTANRTLARIIEELSISLDSGRELSSAMQQHPEVFNAFYVSMIQVGETTGRLDKVFLRLFDHLEFEKSTNEQIKAAVRYPSFVLIAIAAAIVIINIFVIPTFAKMFKTFGADLPFMTQILLGFSNFMVGYWPYLLVLLIGLVSGFRTYTNTRAGKYQWDALKLKIPVAGKIIYKATMSRFARSFALASKSGVPIISALKLVAQTVNNEYIAQNIKQMQTGIERGESILRTATHCGIFNPLVLQMIAVGEESGSLDELMEEIADMYQRDVEYEIKTLSSQIEPILIVFLGIMVLILALGIFLPIWSLGAVALHKPH